MRMATEEFTSDLIALLKIRAPLIFLTCNEEKRKLTYMKHLSAARGFQTHIWDCYLGLRELFTDQKTTVSDDDTQVENGGVTVLVDAMSVQYLNGAEIDYKEDLSGAQFVIRNPNASTTCGCGSSFSV